MISASSIRTLAGGHRGQARGISLLEVLVMAVILGACALALGQAMMGAMNQTRLSDEMRAASFSARRVMEMLLAKDIQTLVADHGALAAGQVWDLNIPTDRGQIFQVMLNDSPAITLPGPANSMAGEVVVLDRESIDPSTMGRNLDGVDGGDGVTMAPWPMDLNGDGVVPSNGVNKRVVVGVVIRWITFAGHEQRYELWSVR